MGVRNGVDFYGSLEQQESKGEAREGSGGSRTPFVMPCNDVI